MGINIEIANKLYMLRKQNGFSQEELAARLGISRQAVSKWERAEVSPDTDNLIALAKLYNISLDELLLGGKSTKEKHNGAGEPQTEQEIVETNAQTSVSFRDGGIHVTEANGSEVHVGRRGIYVNDVETGEVVNIGCGHAYAEQDGHCQESADGGACSENPAVCDNIPGTDGPARGQRRWIVALRQLPYPVLALIGFLLWGFFGYKGWSVSWLFLLTVPLYYTLLSAIEHRNAHHFAYPVLVAIVYLGIGMFCSVWHPTWVIFITIPIYYSLVEALQR